MYRGIGCSFVLLSFGASNARGVAILIRNNFGCLFEEIVADTQGRFLILKVVLCGEQTLLVNIYGPNRDNHLVSFYHAVLKTIIEKDFDSIENIIFGGDFNCPLNHAVDKRGGNIFPRRFVIAAIEQIQSELDVHNIWRIKNPTTRSYTWSQSEPLIFSRLDYWLISNSLSDNVSSVDIIPAIKTDHSAIVIVFQDLGNKAKGPGIGNLTASC